MGDQEVSVDIKLRMSRVGPAGKGDAPESNRAHPRRVASEEKRLRVVLTPNLQHHPIKPEQPNRRRPSPGLLIESVPAAQSSDQPTNRFRRGGRQRRHLGTIRAPPSTTWYPFDARYSTSVKNQL